jgi:hypothetical protein
MNKTFKIALLIWAAICLITMSYLATRGKTDYVICWGVFALWSLILGNEK